MTSASRPGLLAGGGPGVAPLPEGGRVDFTRLRAERRSRLLGTMAASGVDVLVLGRPANVAYASGARQLWTAGTRPFGPACVVVAETAKVHLLSTWDEGVPPEIDHSELFGLSWNPAIVAERVKSIPGLAGASVVATDGWSPGAAELIGQASPRAALVDAGPLLRAARHPRTPDELACIAIAASVVEAALTCMAGALHPGTSERMLVARYHGAISRLGCQIAPSEGVACATGRRGRPRLRRLPSDRPIGAGELVGLNPGAFYGGYQASLARTFPSGGSPLSAEQIELGERAATALQVLLGACRPGATGADLVAAWDRTGEEEPPEPLAVGVGLGLEEPLIGHRVGRKELLCQGQVLAVTAWVGSEGAGGVLDQDLVLIGQDGPMLLTHYARPLLAGRR